MYRHGVHTRVGTGAVLLNGVLYLLAESGPHQ